MVHVDRETNRWSTSMTVHLTNAEVIDICDAANPSVALASLILALVDGGLSGPLLQAVASAAVWRLKRKNIEYGNRGVRIKFQTTKVGYWMPAAGIAHTLASLRIAPPDS